MYITIFSGFPYLIGWGYIYILHPLWLGEGLAEWWLGLLESLSPCEGGWFIIYILFIFYVGKVSSMKAFNASWEQQPGDRKTYFSLSFVEGGEGGGINTNSFFLEFW